MLKKNISRVVVSVIIPTRNEGDTIESVIRAIPLNELPPTQVFVVDGQSNDGTVQKARAAGAQVISELKPGYGGAILTGVKHAEGDVIVLVDGDGTYELKDIPKLVNPILKDEADMVIGSRFAGTIDEGAMTRTNRIGNRILTWIYTLLFSKHLTDTQSGLRAIKRSILDDLDRYTTDFTFLQTLIIEASRQKLRIVEVPTSYHVRKGKSKLSPLRDGSRILFVMIKHRFFRPKPNKH